jgi:hypothetical protein
MPTGKGAPCGKPSGIGYCGIGLCWDHWDQSADDLTPEDFRQRESMEDLPVDPPKPGPFTKKKW